MVEGSVVTGVGSSALSGENVGSVGELRQSVERTAGVEQQQGKRSAGFLFRNLPAPFALNREHRPIP